MTEESDTRGTARWYRGSTLLATTAVGEVPADLAMKWTKMVAFYPDWTVSTFYRSDHEAVLADQVAGREKAERATRQRVPSRLRRSL